MFVHAEAVAPSDRGADRAAHTWLGRDIDGARAIELPQTACCERGTPVRRWGEAELRYQPEGGSLGLRNLGHRMAPPHRGQLSRSEAKTCTSSQAQR